MSYSIRRLKHRQATWQSQTTRCCQAVSNKAKTRTQVYPVLNPVLYYCALFMSSRWVDHLGLFQDHCCLSLTKLLTPNLNLRCQSLSWRRQWPLSSQSYVCNEYKQTASGVRPRWLYTQAHKLTQLPVPPAHDRQAARSGSPVEKQRQGGKGQQQRKSLYQVDTQADCSQRILILKTARDSNVQTSQDFWG